MEGINEKFFNVNGAAAGAVDGKAEAAEEEQAAEMPDNGFDKGEDLEKDFDKGENPEKIFENGEKLEEKSSLESEIVRLKEENLRQKTEFEAAVKELKIKNAVLERLYGEGAKNPKLMLRLIDTSKADFDEKGGLVGIDEQIDSLKNSEGYLFGGYQSASIGCFRPEEAGDFSETSKADFSHMTYSQMLRALGK